MVLYITSHTNLLLESSLQHTDGPSVSLANVSAHLAFPLCLSYGIFCKPFWGPLLGHSHSTALLWDTVDSRSRSGPLPALPPSTIPMCFPTSTSVQQPGCDSQQHHSSTEDRSPASPLAQRTHTTPLTPPSVVPAPQCLCGFFEAQNPFPPQHLALPLMAAWPVPSLNFPQSFAFQHW